MKFSTVLFMVLIYVQNAQAAWVKVDYEVKDEYGMPVSTGLIIDTGDRIIPLNRDAYYCPVGMIGL